MSCLIKVRLANPFCLHLRFINILLLHINLNLTYCFELFIISAWFPYQLTSRTRSLTCTHFYTCMKVMISLDLFKKLSFNKVYFFFQSVFFKTNKKLVRRVELFWTFTDLLNVWNNTIQLVSHICIQSPIAMLF